ncbi:hypothetical protein [Novosphingobium panipatense]|uniref:hypothetical protein n=1 Tax=Novosphingobium panipatense TaxID=428991 RepID=UPI0036088EC6
MKPVEARTKVAEPEAKAEPRSRTAKASEAPAKGKAKADTAKKKPAHPSRTWVQIGVGRDKAAIAFDWRRNVREYGSLFKSREPYVSDMGHTNRVVVGPSRPARRQTRSSPTRASRASRTFSHGSARTARRWNR